MRRFRLVLYAMLLALPFAATAIAQDVEEDVGVGPAMVAAPVVYGPPSANGAITLITLMVVHLTATTGLTGSTAASSWA